MILENGVIRTMDTSVPVQRALAIAGDRVAGGMVPTRRRSRAGVVDLGGRCVLPAFTDSHVHFPTWALALHQVRLEGVGSLDEALERVRAAVPGVPAGSVLRGFGWRDAEWAAPPTKEALDTVTGNVPAALFAHDYHSLWVNSATLALADTELEVPGGVVERDESGKPTGVLREESAWQFREEHLAAPDEEYVDAMREGLRVAASRGVTAVHDKDGWLGAARFWRRLHEQEALTLRVWQSLPHEHLDRVVEAGLPQGLGDAFLRVGYLKAFMDGTLGSQTARMLDGSGVEITSGAQLADIVTRAAAAGWPVAVHAIGDLANREALDAFERTHRSTGARAGCVPASSTHSASPRRIFRATQLWAWPLPSSSAMHRRTAISRSGSGPIASTARMRSVRSWSRARWSRTARTRRSRKPANLWAGVCAGVLRTLDERPAWRPEQAVTVDQALAATIVTPAWLSGDERRRGKLLPGDFADLVVLDRDPLDCDPSGLPDVAVVATMVGGRWVHNPPPWA